MDITDINRARQLLGFMDAHAAAHQMVESGMTAENAFLAIKAAEVLTAAEDK